LNGFWSGCIKENPCCGVNCNDFDECTNDYCVEGACVFEQTGKCIALKEFLVELDEVIKEGKEFTVTVKNKESNQPVNRASVSYGSETSYTNENGMVSFTARRDFIKLRIEKNGYLTKEVVVPVIKKVIIPKTCGNNKCDERENLQNCPIDCFKQEPRELVIEAPKRAAIGQEFTVTVKNEKGKAIEGVTVTYGSQEKTTNAKGTAVFLAEENQKTIKAQKGTLTAVKELVPFKPLIEVKGVPKEATIAGLLVFSLAILFAVHYVMFKIRK
jgi:hypothetical protein